MLILLVIKGVLMIEKEDLLDYFDDLKNEEINNGLKPDFDQKEGLIIYSYKESHYVFINNVTISFNQIQLDEDNIHFYIDDEPVAAIAILNIENIN